MTGKIDVHDFIGEMVPEPIRADVSDDGSDYDARVILEAALRSYQEALDAAPPAVRPLIARALYDASVPTVDPAFGVYFRNSNLPMRLHDLIREYNGRVGLPPVPQDSHMTEGIAPPQKVYELRTGPEQPGR